MFEPLLRKFRRKEAARGASVPDGERVYVIGDVHGRLDLLEAMVRAIEEDDGKAGAAETTVVFLGDLVDRGPDSCGVIRLAMLWTEYRRIRFLMGNHEEMFLASFKNLDMLRQFLKVGGRETILSYEIPRKDFNRATVEELQELIQARVPKSHRRFLRTFEDMIEIGDYLFVHAGIDPTRPLDQQRQSDLRWIREPFLRHREDHSHVIVHGHTIFENVDERPNRIGIDTGAYRFGCLTALVLEGSRRRYIQTVSGEDGTVSVVHRDSA